MDREMHTTQFAPAERTPVEILEWQVESWQKAPHAPQLFNAVSDLVLVLNTHRQIVFATESFQRLAAQSGTAECLGHRPGEALNCTHAGESTDGCGTTVFCSQCGAVNAILEGLAGRMAVLECRMLRQVDGRSEALDLRVQATPIEHEGEHYCLLAVSDISAVKRREVLERSFFHDLINTAGGVKCLLESLELDVSDVWRPDLQLARIGLEDLLEQVYAQRDLSRAEVNELVPSPATLESRTLLSEVAAFYRNHSVAAGRSIRLDLESPAVVFMSDRTLLMRTLVNLLKNALEACRIGECVTLACDGPKDGVVFRVHNPGVMAPEVRLQVFNRSFSTKGCGRGIGTYSVKLITERYLRGRVSFESTPGAGTTFRVELPRHWPSGTEGS